MPARTWVVSLPIVMAMTTPIRPVRVRGSHIGTLDRFESRALMKRFISSRFRHEESHDPDIAGLITFVSAIDLLEDESKDVCGVVHINTCTIALMLVHKLSPGKCVDCFMFCDIMTTPLGDDEYGGDVIGNGKDVGNDDDAEDDEDGLLQFVPTVTHNPADIKVGISRWLREICGATLVPYGNGQFVE